MNNDLDASLNEILDLLQQILGSARAITDEDRAMVELAIQSHFHRFPRVSRTSPLSAQSQKA